MNNIVRRKLISLTDFLCWASVFLALVCALVIVLLGFSWWAMWNVGNDLHYFVGCPLSDSGYCMPPPVGSRDKFSDSAAFAFLFLFGGVALTAMAVAFNGIRKKLLDGAKK